MVWQKLQSPDTHVVLQPHAILDEERFMAARTAHHGKREQVRPPVESHIKLQNTWATDGEQRSSAMDSSITGGKLVCGPHLQAVHFQAALVIDVCVLLLGCCKELLIVQDCHIPRCFSHLRQSACIHLYDSQSFLPSRTSQLLLRSSLMWCHAPSGHMGVLMTSDRALRR